MRFQYILVFLLFLQYHSLTHSQEVEISQGRLLGSVERSRGGRDFYSFKGIPYGRVGRRFDISTPAEGWTGIRNATVYGPACAQGNMGEEDCLFVNVYTPELNRTAGELLPVIAFIHGGAYVGGASHDYPGDFFMDEGIVFVSFNYRLGALGFLATEDEIVPGNMGLKDQSLALRWIRENIQAFGGDRDQVMISGESAGSVSVSHHVTSPMSAGLFSASWASSGAVLSFWATQQNPRNRAVQLAGHLGCPSENSSVMIECLRNRDWMDIARANLSQWYIDPLIPFSPVVEKPGGPSPFLTEDPRILLETGRFNRVPAVYGVMEDEGLLFHATPVLADDQLTRDLNERWDELAPLIFMYCDYVSDSNLRNSISQRVRNFYFGSKPVNRSTFQELTDVYSDIYFVHGTRSAAILHSRYAPVYTYILGYKGSRSLVTALYPQLAPRPIGVAHGDDLLYGFPNSFPFPPPFDTEPTPSDIEFSRKFVNLMSTFTTTGGNLKHSIPTWKPIPQTEVIWNYLDYPTDRMIQDPFKLRSELWDELSTYILGWVQVAGMTGQQPCYVMDF